MQCCPDKQSTPNLEHARWRATFFRSLYASHVGIAPKWRDSAWHDKEALYKARLKVAEQGLQQVEARGCS